jgi:signal transduction histidine kinase
MNIGRIVFLLIFVQLFFLNNVLSKEYKSIEETFLNKVSSILAIQKNDSILYYKYDSIKSLYSQKKYPKALIQTQELLKRSIANDNIEMEFLSSYLVAEIFYKTNKLEKAIDYYKKAKEIKDTYIRDGNNFKSFSDINYARTLLKIGSTFQKLEKFDSAKVYYKELSKLNSISDKILSLKALSFGNLTAIFERDSLFDEAKHYANKAVDIHKNRNDKTSQAAALINLANVYLSEKKYIKSKEIYFKALELIKNNNGVAAVKYKANLYFNIAWAMRNLKDYKAYDFQELSYEIEDDLRTKEFRGIIDEINAEYNFDAKKDLLLEVEENKRLKDQRTFWMIAIGGFVIILTLLFWVIFYKLRQKNLGLQLSQSKLIQNQNLEKVRSESQVRILNATIDGKETERKQIAETLHDSVSALLSSANLHLQATRSQLKGEAPIEIDKTQEIIKEASQKIRDLSHTLVSSVLLKFGLKYAIKDMADKYSNSQIKIDTRIGETRRYHQDFEIKVYNIIQEFVNNILKHSKAEKAIIKLEEVNGKLYLKITDDGIGFDTIKITNKDGLGLNQIEARIQMMQGDFNIDSSKKNGTVIKFLLPILEKEAINLV